MRVVYGSSVMYSRSDDVGRACVERQESRPCRRFVRPHRNASNRSRAYPSRLPERQPPEELRAGASPRYNGAGIVPLTRAVTVDATYTTIKEPAHVQDR